MADFWELHLPTEIDFGPGRVRKLGEAAARWGRAALLVRYEDAPPLEPVYAKAIDALRAAGLAVEVFAGVQPEPDAEMVAAGARRAVESGVEVVVALGGGSVIDAAKAIALVAAGRQSLWDSTQANRQAAGAAEALPLIAVPTTAGTGSEVTSLAIITQHGVGALPEAPVKTTVFGPALAPRLALVDPRLSGTCPVGWTAACGADALGHAIEACLSRRANPIATLLAEAAAARILAHLSRVVSSPEDAEARRQMALAALLAGVAIESAGVTLGHALAHGLGALLHVPHGEAVALATLPSLRHNAAACVGPLAGLAAACGLGGQTAEERAERFLARVAGLFDSLGLPKSVRVPHESPAVLAPRLAQNAIDGTSDPLARNPRKIERADLEAAFRQVLGEA